jgi:hypothetical protein
MKRLLTIILSFFLLSSCIPLRIAPNIKEDKIKIAKRFQRHLPKQYALVFKDPKDADEFYYFINTKYQLNHELVEDNVPFNIGDKDFSFSFYEVEKTTKTLNLLVIIIDFAINNDDELLFEDSYTSRKGEWYIALTALDTDLNDALNPNYKHRVEIIKYLRDLRIEYLNTSNYLEAMLKKKTLDESITID